MWAGESCSVVNDVKPAAEIVQDEPSLPGGHEPGLGLFERCLRDHDRMLAAYA